MTGLEIALLGGGGLSLAGGLFGADAAKDAARTQARAAEHAANLQHEQYKQTREDFAPWRQAGAASLSQLMGRMPELTERFTLADFVADPGYAFRQAEGEKALARAAAARGMLTSPASLKELLRYNQGLAADAYGDAFNQFQIGQANEYNRLAGIAGTGQTATAQLGQLGQQGATSLGQALMQAGNARAAGTVGAANAITGGIGQGLNFYTQMSLLNALGAPSYPSSYPTSPMGDFPVGGESLFA